jgi:hypothetical protein
MRMIDRGLSLSLALLIALSWIGQDATAQQENDPIEALMITGGGPWHDYYTQKKRIKEGLIDRIGNINITIDHEGGESKDFKFSRHKNDEWAENFDIVIYNQCNLFLEDGEHVERSIMETHVEHQVPALMLHCPMHTYQNATKKWFDFTGAVSYVHERNRTPFTVEAVEPNHPIMANFPGSWRTPKGELYLVSSLKDSANPLARAYSDEAGEYTPVVWTNTYEGVRVFSNSLGHHNVTMGSDVNLNFVAAGLLWATENLQDDGTPAPGYSGDRGLGWISLWNAEEFGETLNGWRASESTDWANMDWFDGDAVWPTKYNPGTESFQLTHNEVDHNTLVVDGPESYLYYQGRVNGGAFENFEFKTEAYTYPEANSGILFHTRPKDEGAPTYGFEADINTVENDAHKTGGLNPGDQEPESLPHPVHQYFDYYLSVDGRQVTVKVDGDTVNEYRLPETKQGRPTLDRGTVALQATGSEGRVYFRDLMIRTWPDENE